MGRKITAKTSLRIIPTPASWVWAFWLKDISGGAGEIPFSQENARLTSPAVKAENPILSASLDSVPPFFKALGAVAGVATLLNFLWKWRQYEDQTLERASDRILKKFEMSAGFGPYKQGSLGTSL